MSRADLITVVAPYFDMHAYLDETLASVEAQDHEAIEIVIVDDGSPSPDARARLDAILASPRRFPTRVLRKTNGGLADARNAGPGSPTATTSTSSTPTTSSIPPRSAARWRC